MKPADFPCPAARTGGSTGLIRHRDGGARIRPMDYRYELSSPNMMAKKLDTRSTKTCCRTSACFRERRTAQRLRGLTALPSRTRTHPCQICRRRLATRKLAQAEATATDSPTLRKPLTLPPGCNMTCKSNTNCHERRRLIRTGALILGGWGRNHRELTLPVAKI